MHVQHFNVYDIHAVQLLKQYLFFLKLVIYLIIRDRGICIRKCLDKLQHIYKIIRLKAALPCILIVE